LWRKGWVIGMAIRTLVLQNQPVSGIPNRFLERWESVGNGLGIVRNCRNVIGPAKLRKILALSNEEMRELIYSLTGKQYSKSTLSHWEQAERYRTRHKRLPGGYWTHKWMPASMVEIYQKLIVALVLKLSHGTYAARVRKVRVPWRVELWRMR